MIELNSYIKSKCTLPIYINALGFTGSFKTLDEQGWIFCISPSHNDKKTRFYIKNSKFGIAAGDIKINLPWYYNTVTNELNFEFTKNYNIEKIIDNVLYHLAYKQQDIYFSYISSFKAMKKLEMLEFLNIKEEISIPRSLTTEQLLDMILECEQENFIAAKQKKKVKKSASIVDFEKFKKTNARVAEILAA